MFHKIDRLNMGSAFVRSAKSTRSNNNPNPNLTPIKDGLRACPTFFSTAPGIHFAAALLDEMLRFDKEKGDGERSLGDLRGAFSLTITGVVGIKNRFDVKNRSCLGGA